MTNINEENRYNRQELIEGWDQRKLTEATVSIVGSDVLAQYVAIPLVAVGVGNVRLLDNAQSNREMFLDFKLNGTSKVKSLEEKLRIINPTVNTQGFTTPMASDAANYFLGGSDVIIDTTNDPRSKARCLEFALATGAAYFTSSSMPYFGKLMKFDREDHIDPRYTLHPFEGLEQDEYASIVLGGLIAEEVKKVLMGGDELTLPLYYNLTDPSRFTFYRNDIKKGAKGEFAGKKVLMVGAGALGNFVGLGLAKMGVGRIDVIDPDEVEDTNLNRQVLYYDSVGEAKAKALSKKIKQISNGHVNSYSFVDYFSEDSEFKIKYDLLLDCVDNFTARAIMHDYALAHKTPLISGGTDFQAGQVAVYVPGKTACLDCQLEIHKLGKAAEERRRRIGCLEAPNPSVIMTNQIIGGMMVNEARTVFKPSRYGAPINGEIKYGANLETRAGVTPITKVCECKPKGGLSVKDMKKG